MLARGQKVKYLNIIKLSFGKIYNCKIFEYILRIYLHHSLVQLHLISLHSVKNAK